VNTVASPSNLPEKVVAAIRTAVGPGPAALHEPCFAGNELTYLKECLDSGWVSSVGRYVDRFESDLCAFTGSRHAVAAVNGTAALHVCLLLAGVQQYDEVLLPSLTFVATANAVQYCRAIPHFVESSPISLGVDPVKLTDYLTDIVKATVDGPRNRLTGRMLRALVVMHVFGHPADLDPLADVCDRFGIVLVEDAAESLGSFYKGRHSGLTGRLAALSFNGNKIITSGGGGAVLTQDDDLARHAKHLTTTARVPHRWNFLHDEVGYNYRMPNINAALGCAQLDQLPAYLAAKQRLANRYAEAFRGIEGIDIFRPPDYADSNHWLNAILLSNADMAARDAVLEATNAAGFATRPVWTLMHRLAIHQGCPAMCLDVAEDLEARIVNLPSSAALADRGGAIDA
jgi:perosamine synthetase